MKERHYYRMYKVNEWEEEIDCLMKEFKTEKEAWHWLTKVERVKDISHWRCEYVTAIPAVIGKPLKDCIFYEL